MCFSALVKAESRTRPRGSWIIRACSVLSSLLFSPSWPSWLQGIPETSNCFYQSSLKRRREAHRYHVFSLGLSAGNVAPEGSLRFSRNEKSGGQERGHRASVTSTWSHSTQGNSFSPPRAVVAAVAKGHAPPQHLACPGSHKGAVDGVPRVSSLLARAIPPGGPPHPTAHLAPPLALS